MRCLFVLVFAAACAHTLSADETARLERIEADCRAARVASERISELLAKGALSDAAPLEDARERVLVGESATRGDAGAKVTIVEFSDFQCPFCADANGTLAQLEDAYGEEVRLVFKHNPLSFHEHAFVAALAAEAAREQDRFWPMHDALFARQDELSPGLIAKLAQELGLDLPRFQRDLQSASLKARVIADQETAERHGASGTPTFFVNGRKLVGALPLEEFKAVIDVELERASALLASGVTRAELYERLLAE